MSLIGWHPLRELNHLREQMNRLFEDMMPQQRTESLFSKPENVAWVPAIELQETDTDIIVKAQVPGMEAKDLDVQVSQDAVAITGEHREEKRSENQGFFRSEFSYGQFQRIIPLPADVKYEEVKAEFKDGVITLTLPKAQAGQRNIVKVDLAIAQKAREAMTQQRHHEEHLQQTMRTRTAAELEIPQATNMDAAAREGMTEQRMHEEHLEDTMHTRAAAEIKDEG